MKKLIPIMLTTALAVSAVTPVLASGYTPDISSVNIVDNVEGEAYATAALSTDGFLFYNLEDVNTGEYPNGSGLQTVSAHNDKTETLPLENVKEGHTYSLYITGRSSSGEMVSSSETVVFDVVGEDGGNVVIDDVTAPVVSAAVIGNSAPTAAVSVAADEDCVLEYSCVANGGVPSADTWKSTDLFGGVPSNIYLENLTSGTSYTLYLRAHDAAGNYNDMQTLTLTAR